MTLHQIKLNNYVIGIDMDGDNLCRCMGGGSSERDQLDDKHDQMSCMLSLLIYEAAPPWGSNECARVATAKSVVIY